MVLETLIVVLFTHFVQHIVCRTYNYIDTVYEIEVTKGEISHLNNYQYSMAEDMKIEYTPVKEPGVQTLNGLQTVAYCRIRQIGNDFQRTERQRTVLTQISEKAKTMNASQLNTIATSAFEEVYTSLEDRGRGYAANLIYEITKELLERGLVPLLLTILRIIIMKVIGKIVFYI